MSMIPTTDDFLASVLASVIRREADALHGFALHRNRAMEEATRLIHTRRNGILVIAGIGKSGHIGRKMASSFCSLGRPAAFLQAAEASHGDLGIIGRDSVVVVLSNSGETPELSDLLHYCKSSSIPMIAITSSDDSTLARFATVTIAYGAREEACVAGLAPTTTTTLTLAIGDALAVGVSHLDGITAQDFRRLHPGGKLGEKLRTAEGAMRHGDALPRVSADAPATEILLQMARHSVRAVLVDGAAPTPRIVTESDIGARLASIDRLVAADIARPAALSIAPDTALAEAADEMQQARLSSCLVEDAESGVLGLLSLSDCLGAGA